MQYKVSELDGPLLDAAVAKTEGIQHDTSGLPRAVFVHADSDSMIYNPSENWDLAGPIIERERIVIYPDPYWNQGELGTEQFLAGTKLGIQDKTTYGYSSCAGDTDEPSRLTLENGASGATYLISAMRAFVSSKVGDTIELP